MAKNLLDYDGLGYFLSKLKAWVLAQGYTTNTGTITGVKTTAGAHTTINTTSGTASFNVPTHTSHLTNNSNFAVDSSYVHTDNNFTTALKNKLNGIAAGAEVNVVKSVDDTATNGINLSLDNAGKLDVTVSPGSVTSGNTGVVTGGTVFSVTDTLAPKASPALTGTPTAPTAAAGTNSTQIATTAFVTNAVATAAATIPTKTSDLTNDSDFPSDANYVHTDNNYTTTEKNKLAGIASGAEVNVVKAVEDNSNSSNQSQYQARKEDNGITLTLSANGTLGIDTLNGIIGPSSWGYASLDYFVTGNTVYNAIEPLAPKASPALTGTPTAPTADLGTNTTQIATTAFVIQTVANAQIGKAAFQGTVDSQSDIPNVYKKGYHWLVQTAGTYFTQVCEVGDIIYCVADSDVTHEASWSIEKDFTVIQNNLDIAVIPNAEIDDLFTT